jgi:heptaprenyl diphosphate synthase
MGFGGKIMVLLHSQFNQDLHHIVEQIKKSSYHSYVQKHITYPTIDFFQLHFTYLFLNSRGCSKETIEHYCVSQVFIQLALDTHDAVELQPIHEESLVKKRQLTVLSGDFFSSYYYLYLAQNNQVELIQKWSVVIKEVNEWKVDLHHQWEHFSKEEIFEHTCRIKRRLTEAVLSWFDAPIVWHDIYSLFTELRLGMDQWQTSKERFDYVIRELERKLNESKDEVLMAECKLWLDHMNRDYLVIESL